MGLIHVKIEFKLHLAFSPLKIITPYKGLFSNSYRIKIALKERMQENTLHFHLLPLICIPKGYQLS